MSHDPLAVALEHQQAGRYPQAEQLYRQILQADPLHHQAWHLLGLLAYQVNKPETAIQLIGRAVQLAPREALYLANFGLAFEAAGKFAEAAAAYQQAIDIDPNQADAHNNLAVLMLQLGRLPEAAAAAQRAVQIRPDLIEAQNNLGNIYHAQGRLAEARDIYRAAIRSQPSLAPLHANLGNVLSDLGRFDEAEAAYREAMQVDPRYVPALGFLGNLELKRGRPDEARRWYEETTRRQPDDALAHCNLGVILARLGNFDAALASYDRALQVDPNHPDTLSNRANLLASHGQLAAAEASIRRAIELRPNSPAFFNNLATILQTQGRAAEARQACEQALQLAPDHLEARCNLAVILQETSHLSEAANQLEQVAARHPGAVVPWNNLGSIYADLGRYDEALSAYTRAEAIEPADGRRVRIALLTRVMYDSEAQMIEERARIAAAVARLKTEPLRVDDPLHDIGATAFHLSYHARNDRELLSEIAALHRHAAPTLNFVAPHLARGTSQTSGSSSAGGPSAAGRQPRIGIISRYLHAHPVGLHYAGAIERLARDLHLTVFTFGEHQDEVTAAIRRRADAMVRLPSQLSACREIVSRAELDLLLYTDLGMDPITYFLAFARLARVQAVAAGHPVTSGIDTIDYFLSSVWFEPPQADEHYTERLVRFRNLPSCFTMPPRRETRTRRDFQLPDETPLYLCAQTLFKIHPDFDQLAAGILRADPRGRVVLFIDAHRTGAPRLRERLAKMMPDLMDRVLWLPRQSLGDFIEVLQLADVILDTPHFSGGTTTAEALGVGAPIVTLPGEFLRGRVTAGIYQAMGVADLVAQDPNDYVRLAVRLAQDHAWRAEIVAKIESARRGWLGSDAWAGELSDWLRAAAR